MSTTAWLLLGPTIPMRSIFSKQWINYLADLNYTYNVSINVVGVLQILNYYYHHCWFLTGDSSTISILSFCEKNCTIQYIYRKLGTNAGVFSQTLTHGDSKNEIR